MRGRHACGRDIRRGDGRGGKKLGSRLYGREMIEGSQAGRGKERLGPGWEKGLWFYHCHLLGQAGLLLEYKIQESPYRPVPTKIC